MADFESFCKCEYDDGFDLVCLCMNRLPLLVVQRPCADCRAGKHELGAPAGFDGGLCGCGVGSPDVRCVDHNSFGFGR